MAKERLDKIVSEIGLGTRSQVKALIKNGQVRVNGETVRRPEEKADPAADTIEACGSVISYEPFVYYMLNKPAGVLSATRDKREKTVMDLVPDRRKDLFPAGRLDADTEGLLLITNDGELAHRLLSPRHHVDKTYYVETDSPIPADAGERFADPMDLGDFTTMPAVYESAGSHSGYLTIREGKFHQVKRMFQAVGCVVVFLKRVRFGPLELDEALKPGMCRALTAEETAALKACR